MSWSPIILSFELGLITTILLFIIGVPIAYFLAHTQFKGKVFIEALISMPLVLPPTVLGFYLLVVFGPQSMLGSFLINTLGIHFLFSFKGLVLASVIYSLPFMVHPLQSGFVHLPQHLMEASLTLGKSRFTTLIWVLLPNMITSIITALVLTFAHTIGEFGVVLMIGGNIPGQTKVAAIAIYDEVESLNYAAAHQYSFILFAFTFIILLFLFSKNRKALKKNGYD